MRQLSTLEKSLQSKAVTINDLKRCQNKWEEMQQLFENLLKTKVPRDLLIRLQRDYDKLKDKADDLNNIHKWLKTLGINLADGFFDIANIKLRDFEDSVILFEDSTQLDKSAIEILSFFLKKKSALFDASVQSAVLSLKTRVSFSFVIHCVGSSTSGCKKNYCRSRNIFRKTYKPKNTYTK